MRSIVSLSYFVLNRFVLGISGVNLVTVNFQAQFEEIVSEKKFSIVLCLESLE